MPERILIVDDDEYFCNELAEILKAEGYSVAYTAEPLKGEELVRNGDYDTILLDNKMPALTGIDILKNLKKDGIKKRIFFITGSPSVGRVLREEDVSHLVSAVIAKPVDVKRLLESIKDKS